MGMNTGFDVLNRYLFVLVFSKPTELFVFQTDNTKPFDCMNKTIEDRMLFTLKTKMETPMLVILLAPNIYTFFTSGYFIIFRKTG